jgi:hypothetical protein
LREDHIKRLVESDDPIEETWKMLVELWKVDEPNYFRQEEVVSNFEWQLNRIFFEIYDYLKEQCEKATFKLTTPLTTPLIIMDGMSIREANLLIKDLKEEGYEVIEYSYTFSALPSTTERFREKTSIEYVEVMSGKIPSGLDFEKPVWISYPDEILHHAARILPPAKAYEETKRVLFKVLELAKGREVMIISDHGYIMTEALWPLRKEEVKFLKEKVFGSNRYVELKKVDPKIIEELKKLPRDLQYTTVSDGYCCVRGRYFWPVSGYGKLTIHGGLSLMECLVPKIRVRP